MLDSLLPLLGLLVVVLPTGLMVILGLGLLFRVPLSETSVAVLTKVSVLGGLLAAIAVLIIMLTTGSRHVPIEIGNWVHLEAEHFHFHFKFVFDRLSVPFVILSLVLCGTVGAFASVYLHRDPGYRRFFLFYAIFQAGMVVSSVADTIETLFLGWELVGLSSALLIAYFQDRPAPVRNGLRVWVIYRVSDAAFLVAALLLHHLSGHGDLDHLMGMGHWPDGQTTLDSWSALLVGSLLLLAATGKSGMLPFSGWLPRAMEGPTPSSAVFYGALSVHLGTFLLLRISPILEASLILRWMVIGMGLSSALFGAITSRVQSDVKNALAFASLTQVGIITVEIGLGFQYIALIHMIGHACLRTLQLLRAPSILRDVQSLQDAVGYPLTGSRDQSGKLPRRWQIRIYRFALERGYLDSLLQQGIVDPFYQVFGWLDRSERRVVIWLAGEGDNSWESDLIDNDSLEDVAG